MNREKFKNAFRDKDQDKLEALSLERQVEFLVSRRRRFGFTVLSESVNSWVLISLSLMLSGFAIVYPLLDRTEEQVMHMGNSLMSLGGDIFVISVIGYFFAVALKLIYLHKDRKRFFK